MYNIITERNLREALESIPAQYTGDMEKIKQIRYSTVEIYGFPAQAAMVVEECSELTNAICKFRRGRVGEDDIITEIADVMIMCEQLSNYFGKEKVALERERKLTRLEERLSKYEQV